MQVSSIMEARSVVKSVNSIARVTGVLNSVFYGAASCLLRILEIFPMLPVYFVPCKPSLTVGRSRCSAIDQASVGTSRIDMVYRCGGNKQAREP